MMNRKQHIMIIIILSMIIHLFCLCVVGAWWDDYKYYVIDMKEIKTHMIAAGRLDAFFIVQSINWMPAWMFRMMVLLCFSINAVLIYLIILKVFYNEKMALSIAVLYNTIPVNDMRVMKCVYPYTVDLICFWIATYILLTISSESAKKRNVTQRIISLSLFSFSFFMNSLLVFYIIPILLLWYNIARQMQIDEDVEIKKYFKKICIWWEFYILPFVFYIIKVLCFSPDEEGLYAEYNNLTLDKCFTAISIMPKVVKEVLTDIWANWSCLFFQYKSCMLLIVVMAVVCFAFNHYFKTLYKISLIHSLIGVLVGLFCVIIGIYPYVVIRQREIVTVGINGRDAMLVCLGVAIIVYFCLELIRIPNWIQFAGIMGVVVLSTYHFTYYYQGYLRDHYLHMALEESWKMTGDIKDNSTYIYIKQEGNQVVEDCFYALNAMATEVYGDSTRFIANGLSDLQYITTYEKKEIMRNDATYGYSQYNLNDVSIDGIMVVSYSMSETDAVKLKIKEVFDKEKYHKELLDYIEYKYIPISQDESDRIYAAWYSGEIKSNAELLNLVKTW